MFDADRVSDARRDFLANCRVVLTGFGGDPLLAAPSAFVMKRAVAGEWSELARSVWACLRTHGKLPSLGIRSFFTGTRGRAQSGIRPPSWLNQDFVARLELGARCEQSSTPAGVRHPVRPEAYQGLSHGTWPHCFGVFDPGCSGESVEHRHPFFDLRLVRYVLAMPAHPWFERKALLREAMKGSLPDAVRLRPKTVLCKDPAHPVSSSFDSRCRDRLLSAPGLSLFIDRDKVPVQIWEKPALAWREYSRDVRALSLGYWLSYCRSPTPTNMARGAV
jgi:asparagine synthase (glutamine-hydrolysing)